MAAARLQLVTCSFDVALFSVDISQGLGPSTAVCVRLKLHSNCRCQLQLVDVSVTLNSADTYRYILHLPTEGRNFPQFVPGM